MPDTPADTPVDALTFLQTRRSRPAKTLGLPVPGDDQIRTLLQMAARTPDHGKLEPWRFIVLNAAALDRLADDVTARARALQKSDEETAKAVDQFARSHLAVAVIEVQKLSPKIPAIEQTYSAGCVCLSLLNAALASGWGANWLSGWISHDRAFCRDALGLADAERVAGFIHIGTARATPPERPRPDLDTITSWVRA